MTADPRELATNRRLTLAFIKTDSTPLVLIPHERTKMPAGGWGNTAGSARGQQIFKIIEGGGITSQPRPELTLDGVVRTVEFELLGAYDSTVAVRDTFTHQGKPWEVVGVFYDNGYEVRALVSARG